LSFDISHLSFWLTREIPEVITFVKNERGEVTHMLFNVDDIARRVGPSLP
jgi:hypothetical protein